MPHAPKWLWTMNPYLAAIVTSSGLACEDSERDGPSDNIDPIIVSQDVAENIAVDLARMR